jgi:hypothetical protein
MEHSANTIYLLYVEASLYVGNCLEVTSFVIWNGHLSLKSLPVHDERPVIVSREK